MGDETQDGSQNNAEGVDGRPDNRSNGAAQKTKGPDPAISARNAMLDDIDARIAAQRAKETQEVIEGGDDQARAFLARAARERGESLEETGRVAESEGTDEVMDDQGVTDDASAADSVAARTAVEATTPDAQGNDPLAEFVVVRAGKPMFRTKVDGKEQLVPLETARAQLQKHLAADIRLQDIAKQRRDLDARARNIQSAEAALRVRMNGQPSARTAAVDDQALETESLELVRSLVNEPEPVAAKKMATVLSKIRQAAAPQVDVNAIATQAAGVAVQAVAARDHQSALTAGLSAFKKDYADLAADPDLFAMADRRTDAIAEEHPEWSPTQVMLEAGKQTREWLAQKSGRPHNAGRATELNGRQQRKDGLRPMPAARTARAATTQQVERPPTPEEALAEIRKSRGQFV